MRVFYFLKFISFRKIYIFLKEILLILIGCLFVAFGTACFLLPCKLSSGGFAGIATIIYYFFDVNMATTIIILNVPLFIIGFIKCGPGFILRTIIATFLYSKFIDIFEEIIIISEDRFLASVYGGVFIGIGLALVLKANTSTGGTDLIAHIAQNYKVNMRISNIIMIIDILVVISNLIAFKELEIGLYSGIAIYIIGKMIDIIFEGVNFCKVIYIISDKFDEISKVINLEIKRGATKLYAKGSYTRRKQNGYNVCN